MRSTDSDPEAKCPVDHKTREKWLEAAKAKSVANPPAPQTPTNHERQELQRMKELAYNEDAQTVLPTRFSLDTLTWRPFYGHNPQPTPFRPATPTQKRPKITRLSTDREISTIPRAFPSNLDPADLNPAERAAAPSAASDTVPANAQGDTGHDEKSGHWIYPSQEMFFSAMKRKGHAADAADMASIVPIHNAVNEKAWAEIKAWERGRGSEACGGPKLISFSGDSKALTPRARWNSMVLGYSEPFDRHDWVVERCGKKIEYVIDFYSGKDEGLAGKSLNFFLDVRPKLNSWEGVKMRMLRTFGM